MGVAHVADITGVDAMPDVAHDGYFGMIIEFFEDGFFEHGMGGSGEDAAGIHVRMAGASETEIENGYDFVFFVD